MKATCRIVCPKSPILSDPWSSQEHCGHFTVKNQEFPTVLRSSDLLAQVPETLVGFEDGDTE